MTVTTLDRLSEVLGRSCYEHVTAELGGLEIPMLGGSQSQGDVRVRPLGMTPGVTVRDGATWVAVPAEGLIVVAGQHDHVLAGPGVRWTADVDDVEGLAVGVVDAPSEAYLWHQEHGATGMAAGTYVLRRQREMADQIRQVAD